MTVRPRGLLFIVSGPSGAGKDTVVDRLRRRLPRLRYSVSATTRAPRPGEREGEAYFFTDPAAFKATEADSGFLETREYNGQLYGTPRAFIEDTLSQGYDVVMKPEVNGALAIRAAFSAAVLIFILPDKFSNLESRLAARRTESNEEIAERLAIAHEELKHISLFDYVIVNQEASLEESTDLSAVDDLEVIVHAERLRIHHYPASFFKDIAHS